MLYILQMLENIYYWIIGKMRGLYNRGKIPVTNSIKCFCHHLASVVHRKLSHLNLLL